MSKSFASLLAEATASFHAGDDDRTFDALVAAVGISGADDPRSAEERVLARTRTVLDADPANLARAGAILRRLVEHEKDSRHAWRFRAEFLEAEGELVSAHDLCRRIARFGDQAFEDAMVAERRRLGDLMKQRAIPCPDESRSDAELLAEDALTALRSTDEALAARAHLRDAEPPYPGRSSFAALGFDDGSRRRYPVVVFDYRGQAFSRALHKGRDGWCFRDSMTPRYLAEDILEAMTELRRLPGPGLIDGALAILDRARKDVRVSSRFGLTTQLNGYTPGMPALLHVGQTSGRGNLGVHLAMQKGGALVIGAAGPAFQSPRLELKVESWAELETASKVIVDSLGPALAARDAFFARELGASGLAARIQQALAAAGFAESISVSGYDYGYPETWPSATFMTHGDVLVGRVTETAAGTCVQFGGEPPTVVDSEATFARMLPSLVETARGIAGVPRPWSLSDLGWFRVVRPFLDFRVGQRIEVLDVGADREERCHAELRAEDGPRVVLAQGAQDLDPDFFIETGHYLEPEAPPARAPGT